MRAAATLRYPLKAATYETLIGLLAAPECGWERPSVSIELTSISDGGVITVLRSKFGKSRRLPLHESTTRALIAYARRRDQLCSRPEHDSFFVSLRGTRLDHSVVDTVFRALIQAVGLEPSPTGPARAHDLRHTFAVDTLADWHRSGVDVGARLPALSTYMGTPAHPRRTGISMRHGAALARRSETGGTEVTSLARPRIVLTSD